MYHTGMRKSHNAVTSTGLYGFVLSVAALGDPVANLSLWHAPESGVANQPRASWNIHNLVNCIVDARSAF